MTTRRRFPCRPEAVTAARRFVRESMVREPPETVEAAELMTSELASNCVRHARSEFELVIRTGSEIRVELHDDGGGAPTQLSPTPREVSGRGLLIVAAMSSEWGVTPTPSGKQVWFTLPAREAGSGEPVAPAEVAEEPAVRGGDRTARTLQGSGPRGSGPRGGTGWRPRARGLLRAV